MSSLFYEPYFEKDALSNVRSYRYSAVDKSLIYNHVLRHLCDEVVKLFPLWMAPNLITLSGFGFITINVILLAVFAPNLLVPGPSWLYFSFAIGLFLYQTFDNVDGRQARRTGTSSALGHIFDHTIDSLNCSLGGLMQAASLAVGPSPRGVFLLLVGCAAMWFSTWEEYHTKTLYLGYFNGPTEGVLIACAIHIVSSLFGPKFWLRPVQSIKLLHWIKGEYNLHDIVIYMALFSLVAIHIPECVANVRKSCRQNDIPFLKTLTLHLPFLLFILLVCSWVLSPMSHILSKHRGVVGGFIEFAIVVTFSFGKLSPRIILARLTASPFPWFDNVGAFVPLALGAVYVNLGYVFPNIPYSAKTEILILHISLALSSIAFLYWAYNLCTKFMETLGIGCLTIKRTTADYKA